MMYSKLRNHSEQIILELEKLEYFKYVLTRVLTDCSIEETKNERMGTIYVTWRKPEHAGFFVKFVSLCYSSYFHKFEICINHSVTMEFTNLKLAGVFTVHAFLNGKQIATINTV